MVPLADMSTLQTYIGFLLTLLAGMVPVFWGPQSWTAKKRWGCTAAVLVVGFALSYALTPHKPAGGESGSVIAGVVVDESNRSISGAEITIPGRTEADYSESNGNFRIDLKEGSSAGARIRVRTAKAGYQTDERTVTLPANDLVIPLQKR